MLHVRRTILFYCLVFLFFPQLVSAKAWNMPPLPSPPLNEEVIMIFATKGRPNKDEIESQIKKLPSIRLRTLFTETFEGFSVRGKRKDLTCLSQAYRKITATYENNSIKVEELEQSPLTLIGAERAQRYYDLKGNPLTGKGIKIGIIDTGIDYAHPDLRGNFSGGYDLVDRDSNPMETLKHEGKPTMHGTHVAGIIAANGKMKGVAPEAKIYAYRALGAGGSGTTEQVLAAIDQSVKDKMDIINLSLGSNINGPDLPISMALNHAVRKGIIAVTSNGNSGPNMWTVGTPGTATEAISVGASTPMIEVPYLSVASSDNLIKLTPLIGSVKWKLIQSYPVKYIGLGKKSEALNVSGKIALVKRGELNFSEKVKNAEAAGAIAVIIFNNTKGNFQGKLEGKLNIPAMSISELDGKKMIREIKRSSLFVSTILKKEKDFIADFSSRGPVTMNWEIKPDITAPGVAIKSTIPNRSYMEMQGTSMAAPYIAGAAALIKQAHPNWNSNEIKAAIMNTATTLQNEKRMPYRVFEQGAGRINIDRAIRAETLVFPGSLTFGVLSKKYDKNKRNIVVKNMSKEMKQYHFELLKYNRSIDWKLPLPFTLKPGEKRILAIEAFIKRDFQNNAEMIDGRFLLVEKEEKIKIPYLLIKEKPSYPRIMGFSIVPGDQEGFLRYEVYLPMGAEEFGIALFDSSTLKFIEYLDVGRNIGPGMKENQVKIKNYPYINHLTAVSFARKNGQEDFLTHTINYK